MKLSRPISVVAAAVFLCLCLAFLFTRWPQSPLPLASFGELPVWMDGRAIPLNTVAKVEKGKAGGARLCFPTPPIEWLAEVLLHREAADKRPLFPIGDAALQALLSNGQPASKSESSIWSALRQRLAWPQLQRFSFEEIQPRIEAVEDLFNEGESLGLASRSSTQYAAQSLLQRLERYEALRQSLWLFESGPQTEQLRSLAAFVPEGMAAVRAQRSGRTFDRADYRRMIDTGFRMQTLKQQAAFWPMPPRAGDQWRPLAAAFDALLVGPDPPPAAVAYAALADAYREPDPTRFAQALEDLKAEYAAAVPESFSQSRLEALLGRAHLLYLAAFGYGMALLCRLSSWLRGLHGDLPATAWIFGAAFGLHSASLLLRLYLHQEPIAANLPNAFLFVGWSGALLGILLERLLQKPWHRAPACILALLCLLLTLYAESQTDSFLPLDVSRSGSFWFAAHSLLLSLAYAASLFAGFAGALFILQGIASSKLDAVKAAQCHQAVLASIAIAAIGSAAGAIAGSLWSDQTSGSFWSWRPSEVGALALALWSAAIVRASRSDMADTRRLMQLAVLGGAVAAWSWLGIAADPRAVRNVPQAVIPQDVLSAFIAMQIGLSLLGSLHPKRWRSPDAAGLAEAPDVAEAEPSVPPDGAPDNQTA